MIDNSLFFVYFGLMEELKNQLENELFDKPIPTELHYLTNDSGWKPDELSGYLDRFKHVDLSREFSYLKLRSTYHIEMAQAQQHDILRDTLGEDFVPKTKYHEIKTNNDHHLIVALTKFKEIRFDVRKLVEDTLAVKSIGLDLKQKKHLSDSMNLFIKRLSNLKNIGHGIDTRGRNNLVIVSNEGNLEIQYLDSTNPLLTEEADLDFMENLPKLWAEFMSKQ